MRLTATGAAPVDEVWDRYVRPSRWPQWSPQIRSVQTSDERLRAGLTGRVHGPFGVRVGFTVDAVDEAARTWSWRVHVGPIVLRLHHAVRASEGDTRTDLDVDGPLPVVLGYAPLAQWALQRLVRP